MNRAIRAFTVALALASATETMAWETGIRSGRAGLPHVRISEPIDGGDVIVKSGNEVRRLGADRGKTVWRRKISNRLGTATMIAVDSDGSTFAAGYTRPQPVFDLDKLPKPFLSALDDRGKVRWNVTPDLNPGAHEGYPSALKVLADGNIALATFYYRGGTEAAIAKLSGVNGSEIWRWEYSHTLDSLVEDHSGDLLAAGAGDSPSGVIVKLAGDGSLLWEYSASSTVRILELDGNDNAIAAAGPSHLDRVIKVDSSGNEQWTTFPAGAEIKDLATDSAGDVVVAGKIDGLFGVIKLDGDNGGELWRRVFDGIQANGVATDSTGDVVATGATNSPLPGAPQRPVLMKLAGADGSEIWHRKELVSSRRGTDTVGDGRVVSVDTEDDVIAFDLQSISPSKDPSRKRYTMYVRKRDGATGED